MKIWYILKLVIAAAIFVGPQAYGQALSPVAGVAEVSCPGGSDTYTGFPYHRDPAYAGTFETVERNPDAGKTVITPSVTAGWTTDELVGSHYLIVTEGREAGKIAEITANQAGSVEVDGPLISRAGDKFEIVPHLTLESILPAASQTALHQSSGKLSSQRGSELMVFNQNAGGIESSAAAVYFVTASGWISVADDFAAAGNTIIQPGSVLAIRHQTGAAATSFSLSGNALDTPRNQKIVSARTANENFVAAGFAKDRTLSTLGLSSAQVRGVDEVQLFDNSAAELNKAPTAIYTLRQNRWREKDTNVDANDTVIPAGSALVIRKAAATADRTVIWKQTP